MRVHVAAEIADSRLLRRAWAFSLFQSGCARALTVGVDIVQGLATCGRASAHLPLVNMVDVANLSALRGSCGSIRFRVEQAVET
jgi:hypothetical protein